MMLSLLGPGLSAGGPAAGQADTDPQAFGDLLGLAMAATMAAPPALPVAPAGGRTLLDALANGQLGERMLGEPTEHGEPAAAATTERALLPLDPGVSLERDLAVWSTRVAGREESLTHTPAGEPPNQLPEPEELVAINPDVVPAELPSGLAQTVLGGAVAAAQMATNGEGWLARGPEGSRHPPSRPLDGGIIDATVSATELIDRQRASAALVEIAGFEFPIDVMQGPGDRPERRAPLVKADGAPIAPNVNLEDPALVGGPSGNKVEPRIPNAAERGGALLNGTAEVERARPVEPAPATLRTVVLATAPPGADSGVRDHGRKDDHDHETARRGERDRARPASVTGTAPWTQAVAATDSADGSINVPVADAAGIVTLEPKEPVRRSDVVLQLGDDQGDIGRLKVAVRGPLVRATIEPHDQTVADQLNGNLRELKQSLELRGFPEPRIIVEAPRQAESSASTPTYRDFVQEPTQSKPQSRTTAEQDRRDRGADATHPDQRQRSPDRSRHHRQQQEEKQR